MNYLNYFNHTLFKPEIYHRLYDLDVSAFNKHGKRILLIALPFLGLYRPIGSLLSIGMGGCRIVSHLSQAIASEEKGAWGDMSLEAGQTALAVGMLASTLYSFSLGLVVVNGCDCAQSVYAGAKHLYEQKYDKAVEEAMQALGNACYLGFLLTGELEAILLFTLMQSAVCLYQARIEIAAGLYLEAAAKIAMTGIHLYQADHYKHLIERRHFLFALEKCHNLAERALKGRAVRHLIESPLSDLNEKIDDAQVILKNQERDYDFGSHFHGFGQGLVKGNNLAFRHVTSDGKEVTEVEFKVNHAFRSHLGETFQDLNKMSSKEIKEILALTGSHATGISVQDSAVDIDDWWDEGNLTEEMTLEGLGQIAIGANPESLNIYDRVIIRMDSNKTLYDLHELMAFTDLDSALCPSTQEDLNRLKMGHLFRTFFPREATPFERTSNFFSLPIEELKVKIIEKAPEMQQIFDTYFEQMTAGEILPGRIRYRIPGLADKVYELGGRALTTAVTGAYSDEELYRRVASILSMGLISAEFKDTYHLGSSSGLGADYWTGGADSVYTQMLTEKNIQDQMPLSEFYDSSVRLLISLDALETGTYQHETDSFGNRLEHPFWSWSDYFLRPSILEFTEKLQAKEYPGHEIMVKERLDPSFFKGIIVDDARTQAGLLDYLRTHHLINQDPAGTETILGIAVSKFFRIGTCVTEDLIHYKYEN